MTSGPWFEPHYATNKTYPPVTGWGLRRVGDLPNGQMCASPSHNPPSMIVLEPGVYEWTCPNCGHVTRFTVNQVVI